MISEVDVHVIEINPNSIRSEESLNDKLKRWFAKHKPTRSCAIHLMQILRSERLDVKEFYNCDDLQSADAAIPSPDITENGEDAHLNISLANHLQQLVKDYNIDVNVNGLPLFKSSSTTKSWQQFNVVTKEKKEETDYTRLERKIEDIRDTVIAVVKKESETLQSQMKVILETVTEQNVVISRLIRNQTADASFLTVFPLNTEDCLREIDNDIIAIGREGYLKTLKTILSQGGIIKNLYRILSNDIIASFNIRGNHGKKCLDQYKNFYSVLLESIPCDVPNLSGEDLLRRAIYVNKKRLHKTEYLKRKRDESHSDDAQHKLPK